MFANLVNSNLLIREWLNGSLFPLFFHLTFIVGYFINRARIDGRAQHARWWRLWGVPTACALFWIFACETARSGCVWIILRLQNDGHAIPYWLQYWSNITFTISAAAIVVAVLRCTYLFTPPKWGHWYWMYSLTFTVLFLAISHFFPNLGY